MDKTLRTSTISDSYAEHMGKEHDGSNWGSTGAKYSGAAIEEVISSRPYLQTALDYGCGKGTVAQAFPALKWSEYDPGIPGKTSVPSGQFDLVTCTDVMEHVEIEHVDDVIKELMAKTGKVLFVDIACYLTGKTFGEGPYIGKDLHITVHPADWWVDRFDGWDLQLYKSTSMLTFSKGAYKPRVQLIYERL